MKRDRSNDTRAAGAQARRVVLAGCAAAALLLAVPACEGVYGKRTGVSKAAEEELATASMAPDRAVTTVPDSSMLSIRPYAGARAGDPRLEPMLREMHRIAAAAAAVAASDASLEFVPGREPLAELVDSDVPARGDAAMRVVDGVRRPVLRVPTNGLLNGTFVPASHFAPLVIEAAALATAGDRVPPPWLVKGLSIELSGAFDRWLHERAIGGDVLRVSESALFPGDDPEDALTAATRVRALERIARGERPLARFVAARLSGEGEDAALDAVGVHGAMFLDAAAETERAAALEDLALGGPLGALAAAREALADGEPARATAVAPVLRQALADGDADEYVASEVRLVLAEVALEQGSLDAAAKYVRAASAPADAVLRPAELRLLEARIAEAAGESASAARLFRSFAVDFPKHPAATAALTASGISPEVAAAAPGIAASLSSEDPRARGRAAVALGETGNPAVAPALRDLTRDADGDVRRLAYAGLALVLDDEALPDLERGTRDDAPEVRAATLSMLAFADPARGLARAQKLVDDPAPAVRQAAERIVAEAPKPEPKTPEKPPEDVAAASDTAPPPPPQPVRSGEKTVAPPPTTPPRPVTSGSRRPPPLPPKSSGAIIPPPKPTPPPLPPPKSP